MKTFPSLIGLHVTLPCSAPAILLLAATTTDNVVTLTASIQNPALFTLSAFPLESVTTPAGARVFKTATGLLARKLMRAHHDIMLQDPMGVQIRVLSMSNPGKVLGINLFHEAPRFVHSSALAASAAPAAKKVKKVIAAAAAATVTDISGSAVSGSAVSGSAVVMDVSGGTTTVAPPVKRIKPSSSSSSSIHPFVAKQLLELAILKHETCPIVAEEFSANNTAVMPCGHLFARMAIEETFKKEPSKCPACRQFGLPTFI